MSVNERARFAELDPTSLCVSIHHKVYGDRMTMSREEALATEGTGWAGDLAEIRSREEIPESCTGSAAAGARRRASSPTA